MASNVQQSNKMQLMTALATPFKNGKLCLDSFERLLRRQTGHATQLLCAGTTGEEAMLCPREKRQLVETAKSTGLPVWVGISGPTKIATRQAKFAKQCGADGVLISPPSFFKCTQKGYVLHVQEVLQVGLPVILYNAPLRCGYTIWPEAVLQLAEFDVSLKDAGGDCQYAQKVCGHLPIFCGNDENLPEYLQKRLACGVVSVVSNAFPSLVGQVLRGQATAEQLQLFEEFSRIAFAEINPIPIKYALFRLGVFDTFEVRLPLTPAERQTQMAIDEFCSRHVELC